MRGWEIVQKENGAQGRPQIDDSIKSVYYLVSTVPGLVGHHLMGLHHTAMVKNDDHIFGDIAAQGVIKIVLIGPNRVTVLDPIFKRRSKHGMNLLFGRRSYNNIFIKRLVEVFSSSAATESE
jgi:hypothetical protein